MDNAGVPLESQNSVSYECVYVCRVCEEISTNPFCSNNCTDYTIDDRQLANSDLQPEPTSTVATSDDEPQPKPLLGAVIPPPAAVAKDWKKKVRHVVQQAYMCCVCGRESTQPTCPFDHDIRIPKDRCKRCGVEFQSFVDEMRHVCRIRAGRSRPKPATAVSLPENLASLVHRGILGMGQYQVVTLPEDRLLRELSQMQSGAQELQEGPAEEFVMVVKDEELSDTTVCPIEVDVEVKGLKSDASIDQVEPPEHPSSTVEMPSPKSRQYFRCMQCNQEFETVTLLVAHVDSHGGDSQEFQCQFCLRSYRRPFYFRAHLDIHVGLLPLVCTFCDAVFLLSQEHSDHLLAVHGMTEDGMRNFMSTVTKTDGNETFCMDCRSWIKKENYATHIKYHEMAAKRISKGEGPVKKAKPPRTPIKPPQPPPAVTPARSIQIFECNICSAAIRSIEQVQAHLEEHARSQLFKCEFCNKRFSTADSLKRHNCPSSREAAASTSVGKKSVATAVAHQCGTCGKRFAHAAGLACHQQAEHSASKGGGQQKQYECDQCPMKFRALSVLLIHRARCH